MTDSEAARIARYREIMATIDIAIACAYVTMSGVTDDELRAVGNTLDRAHAVGPVLDPTAYRAAIADGRLDAQRDTLRAARFIRTIINARIDEKAKPT